MKFTNPKIDRNAPCWCGSGKKYKHCHEAFDEKIRSFEMKGAVVPSRKLIKTPLDIEGIKASAKINIKVLDAVSDQIKVGMSTEEIDQIVYDVTKSAGAIPAPLHYEGFPKSVCTSINEGYFSDSSRMFCIGNVSPENKKLVDVTKECVEIGIKHVIPWTFLGDMGHAVHQHAVENGYSVVRQIGGHGCGLEFHEDPWVSYVSEPGTEMLMVPGMCFTIEPMVNMGSDDIYEDEDNGWTIYTEDGKPSAQWEVQVLVTDKGCEVLAY